MDAERSIEGEIARIQEKHGRELTVHRNGNRISLKDPDGDICAILTIKEAHFIDGSVTPYLTHLFDGQTASLQAEFNALRNRPYEQVLLALGDLPAITQNMEFAETAHGICIKDPQGEIVVQISSRPQLKVTEMPTPWCMARRGRDRRPTGSITLGEELPSRDSLPPLSVARFVRGARTPPPVPAFTQAKLAAR